MFRRCIVALVFLTIGPCASIEAAQGSSKSSQRRSNVAALTKDGDVSDEDVGQNENVDEVDELSPRGDLAADEVARSSEKVASADPSSATVQNEAIEEIEKELQRRKPQKTSLVVSSAGTQHVSRRHAQQSHSHRKHSKPAQAQDADAQVVYQAPTEATQDEEDPLDFNTPIYSKLQKALQESAKDIHELGKRRRGLQAAFKDRVKELKTSSDASPTVDANADVIQITLPAMTTLTAGVLLIAAGTSLAVLWMTMPPSAHALQPWLRWDVGLVVLFCAYTCLSISFKFFVSTMKTTYSPTFFVTICGLSKLVISFVLFRTRDGPLNQFVSIVQSNYRTLALYAAPAMLYTTSDVLTLLILRRLDPVAVQLLSQMRNVAMSIFWQIIFKKRLSFGQNVGVLLICMGMLTKDLDSSGVSESDSHFNAYTLMALCFLCNSAAALWTEKLLKDIRLPINVQNISYCTFSTAFGFLATMAYRRLFPEIPLVPPSSSPSDRILYAAAVLTSSAFGIVVSHFLKRLGNVLRMVSASLTICISMPLQWAVLGYDFSFSEFSGITTSMVGIVMYGIYDLAVDKSNEKQSKTHHDEETCQSLLLLQHSDVVKLGIPPLDVIDICQKSMSGEIANMLPDKDGKELVSKPTLMSDGAEGYFGGETSLKNFQLVVDSKSGIPVAALDSTWISAMRVGAASALSIKSLAAPNWSVITFLSLGNSARATVLCILATCQHQITVRVLRCEDETAAFSDRFSLADKVTWEQFDDAQAAVSGADVIVCGKDASLEACNEQSLKPGALVLSTASPTSSSRAVASRKGFLELKTREELQKAWSGMDGRNNTSQRIVAYDCDLTTLDSAISLHAYKAARKGGVGVETSLNLKPKNVI